MEHDLDRKKQFLVNAAYYSLIMVIIYVVFRYVIYFATPFIVAGIITLALKKPIDNLARSYNLPRRGAAGIVVLLFYLAVIVGTTWSFVHILWLLFNWLGDIPMRYADSIEPAIEHVLEWYEQQAENFAFAHPDYIERLSNDILAKISEIILQLSQQAIKIAQSLVFSIPKFVIGSLFCIISTLFMSLDFPAIKYFILEQFSFEHQRILLESKQYVVNTFGRILISYGAIMFITMSELYIGFMIIGIEDAMVMSMLIAMFDILPALGTGGIMVPWVIIEMLNENYTLASELFVLYIIVTVIRNFVEPKLVGDRIGLHPVLVLMSIFLGASLFGPMGILIMPFMLIVIKRLNDTGRIRMFRSVYAPETEEPGFFELKRKARLKRQARREQEKAEKEAAKQRE
jgi:sporulation integral membrane protein YtvI